MRGAVVAALAVFLAAMFTGTQLHLARRRPARRRRRALLGARLRIPGAGARSVVAKVRGRHVKAVRATATGTFRVRFVGVSVPACTGYVVRATGNKGSRAYLRHVPECARTALTEAVRLRDDERSDDRRRSRGRFLWRCRARSRAAGPSRRCSSSPPARRRRRATGRDRACPGPRRRARAAAPARGRARRRPRRAVSSAARRDRCRTSRRGPGRRSRAAPRRAVGGRRIRPPRRRTSARTRSA